MIYIILSYLIVFLFFYFSANSVMYQPPRPATYQDGPNIIKIKTKSDQLLSALYLHNPKAKFTILYSHGNAGDLGSFYPIIQLYQQQGFSIFAYDYSGYGTSTGSPSEDNSYSDIVSAYKYLTHNLKVDPQQILIYGQSIGSGPSVELASHYPARALILESPMVSAFRTITRIPLFPFDKYKNLAKITKVNMPIFVIHGTQDHTISTWHGKKIFNAITGTKKAYWVPGADHNDLLFVAGQQYWTELNNFTQQLEEN